MKPPNGRNRVVIEEVSPVVDGGSRPVCRIMGDTIKVTAAIFADGHDRVAARLRYRLVSERKWRSAPMSPVNNDIWEASFRADRLGEWRFSIDAWVDHFDTWVGDLKKRLAAQTRQGQWEAGRSDLDSSLESGSSQEQQDIPLALRSGALLIKAAEHRAPGADAKKLSQLAASIEALAAEKRPFYENPLSESAIALVQRYPDLSLATQYEKEIPVRIDRDRARFSAWYELFPRSAALAAGQHGSFADVERQLSEIAAMGFDVLYLPPIHPIGRAFRKGPNNTTVVGDGDPGSPWAIGDAASYASGTTDRASETSGGASGTAGSHSKGEDGGHKSIHPQLGTLADFERLMAAASTHNIEIALDIAFQCSPDHPWVAKHPDWFVIRPDGSIQYAENPPKKYQDIYPLNFESPDWRSLWNELYSVFEFWIQRGVLIFRVDNPHTKALPFWEWCLSGLQKKYPEVIFLAEAFTRPQVMYALAKRGFTQSYTYFTWRTAKVELEEYLEEITRPPVSDFFKPNFWPNTPDILHKSLQEGGRPAFMQRLILAATLVANYGIYGPAYELCENAPAKPAPGKTESEEYLDSEKYEIRQRDRNAPGSLVPLITRLNGIRRSNPSLQTNELLLFHPTDNPNLLCYSKSTPGHENTMLMVVNLDPFHEQAGWVHLLGKEIGIDAEGEYFVEDLLSGDRYTWHGFTNYVALKPDVMPAHLFRVSEKRN